MWRDHGEERIQPEGGGGKGGHGETLLGIPVGMVGLELLFRWFLLAALLGAWVRVVGKHH